MSKEALKCLMDLNKAIDNLTEEELKTLMGILPKDGKDYAYLEKWLLQRERD